MTQNNNTMNSTANLPEKLKPIRTPARWTRKQDVEHFHDRCMEPCEPGEEMRPAVEQLAFHADNLETELNLLLDSLLAHHPVSRSAAELLPPLARVKLAATLVAGLPVSTGMVQTLNLAEFAIRSAEPILQRVSLPDSPPVTLFEVVEAGDWLGTAASRLSDQLHCWRGRIQDIQGCEGNREEAA